MLPVAIAACFICSAMFTLGLFFGSGLFAAIPYLEFSDFVNVAAIAVIAVAMSVLPSLWGHQSQIERIHVTFLRSAREKFGTRGTYAAFGLTVLLPVGLAALGGAWGHRTFLAIAVSYPLIERTGARLQRISSENLQSRPSINMALMVLVLAIGSFVVATLGADALCHRVGHVTIVKLEHGERNVAILIPAERGLIINDGASMSVIPWEKVQSVWDNGVWDMPRPRPIVRQLGGWLMRSVPVL